MPSLNILTALPPDYQSPIFMRGALRTTIFNIHVISSDYHPADNAAGTFTSTSLLIPRLK
ncbi:MAG TPA: hypothetical protein VGB50_03530 [Flavobacterium sp.]|jgi:hypothetical protein